MSIKSTEYYVKVHETDVSYKYKGVTKNAN